MRNPFRERPAAEVARRAAVRHGAPRAASRARTVLALMLLYLLTSVSVIVFFRRTRLDERIWHTVLAPLLAIVLLCGATVLALRDFTTLVSASATTALVLELTVVAVLAGGSAARPPAARGPYT
ncbi:hypothetical protein ACOKM5_36945 [Streptomyces sp. BH097]|uniref:hypothetical protein n=1 Tax=unclassified Streptomyces TaxID=2593676 RepID=UPI003BB6932B